MYFFIAVFFQLAPVIHHYNTLQYALKAIKCQKTGDQVGRKRYFNQMLKEDEDVALLRVFECFLEAAPQQVFQITILLKHHDDPINYECNCLFITLLLQRKIFTCCLFKQSGTKF